jgi:chaperone required for assembly of F1-ATPase
VEGFSVTLDGKSVKTPAKNILVLPKMEIAVAVAAEWEAQGEEIDTNSMRLTRLANSAIDRVAVYRDAVIDEIAGYAGTDLVSYRASEPDTLVLRQQAGWDPLVLWLEDSHGIVLRTTTGVFPVNQNACALGGLRYILEEFDSFALAGLHKVTASCGSIVIGLAVQAGRIDGMSAWELSLIEETYQIEEWGEDPEATIRRQGLRDEIVAATEFLRLQQDLT